MAETIFLAETIFEGEGEVESIESINRSPILAVDEGVGVSDEESPMNMQQLFNQGTTGIYSLFKTTCSW